jgi:type I restriction enzyme M protein
MLETILKDSAYSLKQFEAEKIKALENRVVKREPQTEYVSSSKKLDEFMLDEHGHLIVKHDLFNHDGLTNDGIAEAFIEFAKKEGLSFF